LADGKLIPNLHKALLVSCNYTSSSFLKKYTNYIKAFFEPKFVVYEILLPINEVVQKFEEVLNGENASGSEVFKGSIIDNKFNMSLNSVGTQEATFSAALKGSISISNSRQTRIEICIMRDSAAYLTFFLSIMAAAVYFIMYFSNPENTSALFWGVGILVLSSIFSIWFSNSSVKAVQNKFETFIRDIGVVF
jgi:hypothetical protein